MRRSYIAAATATVVVLFGMVGAAQAATLSGAFQVTAVNATDQNSAQSEASAANAAAALANAMGATPGFAYDVFNYTGDIDFATTVGSATTIGSWLATGVGGVVSGLDAVFAALQQSKGDIGAGTATTTFYMFEALFPVGPSDVTVTHDDGFAIFSNGNQVGGFLGPNTVRTTAVPGYPGGAFSLLYVATNSDPSILKVDVAPVPLPAALPLLMVGLGGLGLMRLRRKAA